MMNTTTTRRYQHYALALLGLTLLAGAFLRASHVWPAMRGGVHGPYLLHAHSHAGFFGWAVMAVCAIVAARIRISSTAAMLHGWLAHAIGLGSFAAFIGFALRGYDMTTITLSALHVLFWLLFAALVWRPLAALADPPRRYLRTGLAFLVIAGLATTAPVMMMVRGVRDPWLLQLGVKLFLTPFVSGFLVLTAIGLLYERLRGSAAADAALILIAAGTLPSTLLYVSAAPPVPWLLWLGRAGIGLVGLGLVFVAVDGAAGYLGARSKLQVQRHDQSRRQGTQPEEPQHGPRPAVPELALIVMASAAIAGAVKLLAAVGIGSTFMHSRSIVIAVLHLVLLGVVTPAFVLALRPGLHAPIRAWTYALGLGVMLGAIAVTGWPWAARLVMQSGLHLNVLFHTAAVAGAVVTLALIALFVPGPTRASTALEEQRTPAPVASRAS